MAFHGILSAFYRAGIPQPTMAAAERGELRVNVNAGRTGALGASYTLAKLINAIFHLFSLTQGGAARSARLVHTQAVVGQEIGSPNPAPATNDRAIQQRVFGSCSWGLYV